MATRASISPPCFLRVADASAASMASKMTSLSTPFSLETASATRRISLFMAVSSRRSMRIKIAGSEFGHDACTLQGSDVHAHAFPFHVQLDAFALGRQQRAGEAPAPVLARRQQFQLHLLADGGGTVRRRPQRAGEPERRHE